MTPAQIAKIMALVDDYALVCAQKFSVKQIKEAQKLWDELEAALRDAPTGEKK